MSESLSMVEATSHAARAKGERVTGSSGAGRQRGTPNPSWLRHPNAEPQAVTRSEPRCSIVSATRSDVGSESAEPLARWRRQHPPANSVARPVELFGAAGTACSEGCSEEGGRPSTILEGRRKVGNWLQMICHNWSRQSSSANSVRGTISVTREKCPNAVLGVRGDESSYEAPVMGADAKRPHFDGVTGAVTGSPSHRNAV